MSIEFDTAKDADNIAKHGLSFAEFIGFDAEPVIVVDQRSDYGETRYRAFGRIESRGYAIVFTARRDDAPDQFPSRAREGNAAP